MEEFPFSKFDSFTYLPDPFCSSPDMFRNEFIFTDVRTSGNEICEMPVFGKVLLSGTLPWKCSAFPGRLLQGVLCWVVWVVPNLRSPVLCGEWEWKFICAPLTK